MRRLSRPENQEKPGNIELSRYHRENYPGAGGENRETRRGEDYETVRLESVRIRESLSRSHGLAVFTVPASRAFPRLSAPFRAFPCIKIFPLLSDF